MKRMTLLVTALLLANVSMAATTPKEGCDQLAKAAQENNFAAFSTNTVGKSVGKEKKFQKMHKDKMAALKDLTCGAETVAGDHAVVEATSQSEKRLIPFVQVDGQWKFDIATYKNFYRNTAKN